MGNREISKGKRYTLPTSSTKFLEDVEIVVFLGTCPRRRGIARAANWHPPRVSAVVALVPRLAARQRRHFHGRLERRQQQQRRRRFSKRLRSTSANRTRSPRPPCPQLLNDAHRGEPSEQLAGLRFFSPKEVEASASRSRMRAELSRMRHEDRLQGHRRREALANWHKHRAAGHSTERETRERTASSGISVSEAAKSDSSGGFARRGRARLVGGSHRSHQSTARPGAQPTLYDERRHGGYRGRRNVVGTWGNSKVSLEISNIHENVPRSFNLIYKQIIRSLL